METFQDILARASSAAHIDIGPDEMADFLSFRRELLFWNEKMSLVSLKTPYDLAVKHIIDSLSILPFLHRRNARLLDLGSGGGFPGIPLKIMRDDLAVTFIDSSRKKTSFLKHMARILDFKNTVVLAKRIEDLIEEETCRTAFDYITTRATFPIAELVPMAGHFLSKEGRFICMKGKNWRREIDDAQGVMKSLHLQISEYREFDLPLIGGRRTLLFLEKT